MLAKMLNDHAIYLFSDFACVWALKIDYSITEPLRWVKAPLLGVV